MKYASFVETLVINDSDTTQTSLGLYSEKVRKLLVSDSETSEELLKVYEGICRRLSGNRLRKILKLPR